MFRWAIWVVACFERVTNRRRIADQNTGADDARGAIAAARLSGTAWAAVGAVGRTAAPIARAAIPLKTRVALWCMLAPKCTYGGTKYSQTAVFREPMTAASSRAVGGPSRPARGMLCALPVSLTFTCSFPGPCTLPTDAAPPHGAAPPRRRDPDASQHHH